MIAEESSIVDSIYFDIFGVTYIIVIGFLYYSGFWSEVHVLTEPSEELKISYQYGVGLVESQKLLETYKCTNGPDVIIVRILYDRPKTIPNRLVRWAIGVENHSKHVSNNTIILPEIQRAIQTRFIDRNFMSRWLAQYRVTQYISEFEQQFRLKGGPWVERHHQGFVHFILPLEDGDSFFVEEFFQPSMRR